MRYGKPLLANMADETTELMIDVCCGTVSKAEETSEKPSLRQFFAFFIDQPQWFIKFLETVAARRWEYRLEDVEDSSWVEVVKEEQEKEENEETAEERADKEAVWGTLLELYLQSGTEVMKARALRLLKSPRLGIYCEPSQALIVCLGHDFVEGIVWLYEQLGMTEEVVRLWMGREEGKEAMAAIERYGASEGLVRIGLRFLASRLDRYGDELERLLEWVSEARTLEAVEVVELLGGVKGSGCTLGRVKKYLLKEVGAERMEMEAVLSVFFSYSPPPQFFFKGGRERVADGVSFFFDDRIKD